MCQVRGPGGDVSRAPATKRSDWFKLLGQFPNVYTPPHIALDPSILVSVRKTAHGCAGASSYCGVLFLATRTET